MSNRNHDRSDYDSFMIRLWHGATGERLLRAEIDHIQTGAVFVGRDVPPDWIEQTVHASIRERAGAPELATGDRDPSQQEDDHVS
jgi:hypothetical protein